MNAKSYITDGALPPYRIFKYADEDTKIVLATSSKDELVGVIDNLGSKSGGVVDGYSFGYADLEFGGTVSSGEPVTSDAEGKGIKANDGDTIMGYACNSSVSGDIRPILINKSYKPTAATV